jgi:hypothetical protein
MAVTLTNADIVSRLKMLADYHLKADSGSTTTAVSRALIDEPDITSYFISFISGANIGLDEVITDFTPATGTITFATLDDAVTSVDEFCICSKGFQSDVAQATQAIANDFRNKGYDIDLFLTTSQLKEMYIYKTIELICGGLMNDGNDEDIYFVNYERFKAKYETEQATITADYDENESGDISEDEENLSVSYGILER